MYTYMKRDIYFCGCIKYICTCLLRDESVLLKLPCLMWVNNTFDNVMIYSIILGRSGSEGCVTFWCKWVPGLAFELWWNLLMLNRIIES